MAVHMDQEITINRDRETVMAAIADLGGLPAWSDVHKEVTVEETHEDGRPKVARMKVSVSGISDEQVLEYTWREDGVDWVLREGTQQNSQEGSYRLTDAGGGTHVVYELEIDPKLPLPGFIVKQASKKVMDCGTKGLKKHLER